MSEAATTHTRTHVDASFAWQGWSLKLPGRWNPVKLEGDYARGYVLITDMDRPRLAMRWSTVTMRSFDAHAWAKRAMREEVGQLAADEARAIDMADTNWTAPLLYTEPKPPGRDVWVARSAASGRLVEVVYHAHRRERVLADQVLPTLLDQDSAGPMRWAVFDLSCTAPAGFRLESHVLNAGDLSLSFAKHRQRLVIRQIAVASLALQRLPIEGWLARQEASASKYYRPDGEPRETPTGMTRRMTRRRRFAWMRWRPAELFTLIAHDVVRDRIVIIQSTDEALAHDLSNA